MRSSGRLAMSLLVVLVSLASLPGCGSRPGHGPRSMMSDHDASAACLEEVTSLIAGSDVEGLVAAFSEAARSADPDLASDAEELMGILGGGTLSDGDFWSSQKTFPRGGNLIISKAIVTAPDDTVWRIHIIDCTYDGDDPSQVGLRSIEVIPDSDEYAPREAPQGFGWYNESDEMPSGIRLITSWEGWDPWTSPYSPDW